MGTRHVGQVIHKIALRLNTRMREYTGKWRGGRAKRQIVFVHIPKTAGTSVADYMRLCVGGRSSGRTVVVRSEFRIGQGLDQDVCAKARSARFCTGHMTWPTAERICDREDAFIFTFLRDPRQRLFSLYSYLNGASFPQRYVPEGFEDLYASIPTMTASDFLTSHDPRLVQMTDNVMVRQLAGGMDRVDLDDGAGHELLEAAKKAVTRLDYVGFTETFDHDFPEIAGRTNLPSPKRVPVVKVSRPHLTSQAERMQEFQRFEREVADAIEPLVRWDQQLYEFARSAFAAYGDDIKVATAA